MSAHCLQNSLPPPPCNLHSRAVMVTVLTFHTEEPDKVGGALNFLLFPDLPPLAVLEAALLTWKWDTILGGGTLTSFAETSLLMGKHKVPPIADWYKAASQMET